MSNLQRQSTMVPIFPEEEGGEICFREHAMGYAPKWVFLNESLQLHLMTYIISLGIRPEIGVCIEYLSWNREHRLYIQWLKDIYFYMFRTPIPQAVLETDQDRRPISD